MKSRRFAGQQSDALHDEPLGPSGIHLQSGAKELSIYINGVKTGKLDIDTETIELNGISIPSSGQAYNYGEFAYGPAPHLVARTERSRAQRQHVLCSQPLTPRDYVAYYKMNEGEGDTYRDCTASGRDIVCLYAPAMDRRPAFRRQMVIRKTEFIMKNTGTNWSSPRLRSSQREPFSCGTKGKPALVLLRQLCVHVTLPALSRIDFGTLAARHARCARRFGERHVPRLPRTSEEARRDRYLFQVRHRRFAPSIPTPTLRFPNQPFSSWRWASRIGRSHRGG